MRANESSLRLIVLMAALVAIVGSGYLIRSTVTANTMDAMDWVSHSHQVKSVLFELKSVLNEMEAAAFSAQFDPLSTDASERYGEARARYPSLLADLRKLTIDNPDQQEHVGALRIQIEGRVKLFDEAMLNRAAGDKSAAGAGLEKAVMRYPVDDLVDQIMGIEDDLVDRRTRSVKRQQRVAAWTIGTVTLLQFILLAAVIWGSEKQLQKRLVAETEARQAIERAQLIVEAVREPIALLAPDLRLISCNRAFSDYYGLERPSEGALLSENRAWTDASLLQRLRDVALVRREIWDYELNQRTEGDELRHVLVNSRPITLPNSTDTVMLLTVSDITARKRSEHQILELNRQLEGKIAQLSDSNRELEAFSYSVSHDLRAPLRHITGFASKLLDRIGDEADEKTRHYAEVVMDASRRMSSLIEDLLTYSRLGRHAMRFRSVDLQAMVEEVRIALTSTLEGRDIEWRIAPLPVVIADENMLRLVWQNLIENAIKYSASRHPARIEIGPGDASPTEWAFWIRDNGVGFDMAYASKLFGVFQRLHKASEFAGTGIGLASVRRIISRHGGRVWAEAAPDQGATFHFSLARTQEGD